MQQEEAILIDTGPLVAIVDSDESHHEACLKVLKSVSRRTRLITTSPVLTEAFYLLSSINQGQTRLFELIKALRLSISPTTNNHIDRVRQLMTQYHDLPMDFADAVLVTTAEELKIKTIMTLDRRGFHAYKPAHARSFNVIP
jgi:uncharacterized protein